MEFRFLIKKFLWLFILISSLCVGITGHADVPNTCVISLFGEPEIDQAIYNEATALLRSMGYSEPQNRFVFYNSATAIRNCLQGPYEDVILLAHSMPTANNLQSLVYRYQDRKGRVVGQFLDEAIFRNINVQSTLRQITLVTCESERVIHNYSSLVELAQKNNIYLKLQLADVLSEASGAKLRAQKLFASNIAESAQDENAEHIFCTIRTNIAFLVETGKTSCLRNHYQVNFTAPFAVGLKTTTRWLKLSVSKETDDGDNFSFLNLELGIMRGLNLGLSRQPVSFNKETYGSSFSLFDHIQIIRVMNRSFGYSEAK